MDVNILTIILIVTVIISLVAMNNRQLLDRMMFIPYDVKNNGRFSRFVTHIFIHADIAHLAFNMISLFFLGDLLLTLPAGMATQSGIPVAPGLMATYGNSMGTAHFAILYFVGGLIATTIPYLRHYDNPGYRVLGASGAVSAVVFATILWNPSVPLSLLFIPIPIPAWLFGIVYLLVEYFMDRRGGSGVAHDAHIGGAIFGILYVLIINIDKGKEFFQAIFG